MSRSARAACGAAAGLLVVEVAIGLVAGVKGWSPEGDRGPNFGSALFGALLVGPLQYPVLLLSGVAAGALIGWTFGGRRAGDTGPSRAREINAASESPGPPPEARAP